MFEYKVKNKINKMESDGLITRVFGGAVIESNIVEEADHGIAFDIADKNIANKIIWAIGFVELMILGIFI